MASWRPRSLSPARTHIGASEAWREPRSRARSAAPVRRHVRSAGEPQLWKTFVALGALRQAQGRPEDARNAYRDALAVIEGVAGQLTRESLRATFRASKHVQRIRDAAVSPE
jgi:hypothetical protein